MENAWKKYENIQEVMDFNEGYKNYISTCKTERECVAEAIRIAKENGFKDINEYIENKIQLLPNDKVYYNNYDKSLALFVVGSQPIENGLTILGAHVDSPRLDVKQNPLYEDYDISLMETHYYGGIKPYQWVTLPLALHGVVCKKDGTTVKIVIGEDENDPVVGVSDLLPHLAKKQMEKSAKNVIEAEDLNITVGSIPLKGKEKEAVKAHVLTLLKEKYDIEEKDFISAEIEAVPAGKARDYGLDRSMIIGYGHDDRACAYTSLMALLEVEHPTKTLVCLLVDKEEVGSNGATGMHSKFFENIVAELIGLKEGFSEIKLRRAFSNSKMLSGDVSAAYDPNYPSVNEIKNTAFFGKGISINKYTGKDGKSGANDANPEFLAEIRNVFDKHNVAWQTSELGKVDEGGGGTISYIMANYGMQIVDAGVPVQNMHAPWEVASKVDIYETKQAYLAFLKEM
ncbi:MAG TPA: aminopeptidase [Erysipelotrichaceae bacterium]|nr:aminopeptidase [Erysipelotrichaceae bacterium]HQA84543.1 aminopeptidase [Erysipelotrichaceae bacterium]